MKTLNQLANGNKRTQNRVMIIGLVLFGIAMIVLIANGVINPMK